MKMAAGSKCKYLLYVASADALTNRRRRAANIVRVLQSEEGDHVAYYAPAPVGEAGALGGHRRPSSVCPSV